MLLEERLRTVVTTAMRQRRPCLEGCVRCAGQWLREQLASVATQTTGQRKSVAWGGDVPPTPDSNAASFGRGGGGGACADIAWRLPCPRLSFARFSGGGHLIGVGVTLRLGKAANGDATLTLTEALVHAAFVEFSGVKQRRGR